MGSSETLRSLIDAGKLGKRLDELSTARVIAKVAQQVHAAQQKAGSGKAIGPISPLEVRIAPTGLVSFNSASPGALGYSAPEQLNGGSPDRRSDVFSLGVVMWEALTHQRLFDAMNDAAVKAAVQERSITAPAEVNANVPAELSAICMRALSASPSDRYQSLKAMAVEIEEFLEEAGYVDEDTKIAQYIAGLAGTRKAAAGSVPPLNAPTGSRPSQTIPGLPPSPTPAQPSILTEPRTKSPSASGAALAAALSNAGASSAAAAISTPTGASSLPASSPSTTALGVPPGAVPTTQPLPMTPRPPVLPSGSDNGIKSTISATVPPLVNAATIEAKHETAKPVDDTKATLVETTPAALINAAADALAATPKAEPAAVPTIEAPPAAKPEPTPEPNAAPKAETKAEPDEVEPATTRIEKVPHPASVVTLPGRDSKADVLAGWGWGTGKHDAIAPSGYTGEDDDDFERTPSSKKTMIYVFGGGFAVALLVTIIAFAARGSSSDSDKHRTLARQNQEAVAEQARATEPTVATPTGSAANGSDVAVPAGSAGSDVNALAGSGSAAMGSGSAAMGSDGSAAGSAIDPAAAEKAAADQAAAERAAAEKTAADKAAADKAAAEQAVADKAAADKAAADKAAADKAAAEQAKRDADATKKAEAEQAKRDAAAAKQEEADRKKAEAEAAKLAAAQRKADAKKAADEAAAKKAEERRLAKEEADRKKAEAAKAAKAEPKKRPDKATTTPKTVATADPPKAADPEAAYRQGLQAFARGDNQAALASLRSSIAANPNYANSYRGLGLVYEKMGDKGQARTAYRRYLQLAPTAGDAEIIRGRLERLTP